MGRQSKVWRKLANLSLHQSTGVSLCGHLLTIGGTKKSIYRFPLFGKSQESTDAVYTYKPTTNSWEVISEMSEAQCQCFAVTLPTTNEVIVVGGFDSYNSRLNSVEFANLK